MRTQSLSGNERGLTSAAQRDFVARRLAAVGGVVGFALLTAVGAWIRLPLPDTPVPVTLQTLIVVLAGVTLGPRLATLSMLFYLLLGAVGYHVFAAGDWGLQTLLGATGGYLVGFVLAQPVIGRLAPADGGALSLATASLAGHAVVFFCGVSWLMYWAGCDLATALRLGF
ncbi:MAG TPA: biotin transporter BioY, partial [Phycisphaerae bacterium]|nr:biotin transporter BioY [Phycisphaerae bacterium]